MDKLNNTINPAPALNALFPQSIDCGNGVVVKPFSLATYALLEKIRSYIIIPHQPSQEEVLKTFYICTHDARDTFKRFDELDALAFDWAETVPPYLIDTITEAVLKQVEIVKNAMPPAKETDAKKAQTDG